MSSQLVMPGSEQYEKPQGVQRSPEQMVEWMIEKGANADQIGSLLDSYIRLQEFEKKKAYDAAWALFQENKPDISKTKLVSYSNKDGSQTSYRHAELDKASKIVADALKAVGLSHSWRLGEGENSRTKVTCVIKHVLGHAEDVATLCGPPDSSGGKNNVQAIGSTTFYLERYTLFAGTGIVPEGMDDDGKTEGMEENAILDYCIQIQDASSLEDAKAKFGPAWTQAKEKKDKQAMDRIRKTYEEKKRSFYAR